LSYVFESDYVSSSHMPLFFLTRSAIFS
jgi:hypothetical protein